MATNDAAVRPLVKELTKLPENEIFAFDDLLAEKLHALVTEAPARHIGEDSYTGPDAFFSVDDGSAWHEFDHPKAEDADPRHTADSGGV